MKKIVILGGGMAALSTAFELTDRPGWREHYDITIYQMGWRLGGKGASGRNVSGPPGTHGRIEEHGFHMWLGFYENAFNQIQRCYAEARRPDSCPLRDWTDAFKPHRFVGTEESIDGEWRPWMILIPENESVPGRGAPFPTPRDYFIMLIEWMLEGFKEIVRTGPQQLAEFGQTLAALAVRPHWWEGVAAVAAAVGELAGGMTETFLLDHALTVGRALPPIPAEAHRSHLDFIHDCAQTFLAKLRAVEHALVRIDAARHAYLLLDLAGTTLVGLIEDHLFSAGFDSVDGEDIRDWLRRHGASEFTLSSAFMRSTYDTVFGFAGGDPNRETLAAGTGLRSGLRMLMGYKGSFMWLMQAGMGDVVFAPLYEVLDRRGVKFEFFHRVENLALSADRRTIASITLRREVHLSVEKYQPLMTLKGLPCWPSEPRYEQLIEGEDLQRRTQAGENVNLESFWTAWPDAGAVTLQQGTDFDLVVLGISVAALPHLCPDLIAANQKFAAMVREIKTMRTMGVQLWLNRSLQELGWPFATGALSGFVRPLSTWADMTHLVMREDFPADDTPRHLAYFCGPMRDSPLEPQALTAPEFAAQQLDVVKQTAQQFLAHDVRGLWPNFNWEMLYDRSGAAGAQRLSSQYFRANIDPSERYVLSVPGSSKFRLKTDESGFSNLYLVGDWVRTGLNAGCIEAAVMSGMQASRAIAGYPQRVIGEHDVIPVSP